MNFQRKLLATAVIIATTTLSACSSDDAQEVKDTVLDYIPTDIKLSNAAVNENEKGAEIATLNTIDLDLDEAFSYTTDNPNFVINGSTLSLAPDFALDYETEQSVTFNITVTDSDKNTFTKAVTIDVNDVHEDYAFMSKVGDVTQSSVSYGGQSARHALIAELKNYISTGLQADLDNGDITTTDQVIAKLNSLYNADELSWDNLTITFMDAKQTTFSELSGSYKSLKEKVAGQDLTGQHKDWSTEFAGWGAKGSTTPVGLIDTYFQELANIAIDNLGSDRFDPITNTKIPVYVTENGTDLNQLIQKFLLMSVAYSQATDDYLDENKGLKADNISPDKGTKNYTSLEHQFDEGFGYFGAARDFLAYNDNEIAGKVVEDGVGGRLAWNGKYDTNGDGGIDLLSEFNFGNSVNAAKRDRGSKELVDGTANPAATDYTKITMEAFINGRKLINDKAGMALSTEEMATLITYRDVIVNNWEFAVAGTVIHYINDLHSDLGKLGTADFDYSTAAKHFSELKGFALGLQFNPYSPITDVQFEEFHRLIEDAPALATADVETYQANLIKARDILQSALNFDAATVANW